MFVEILTNSDCLPFATVIAKEGRFSLLAVHSLLNKKMKKNNKKMAAIHRKKNTKNVKK